MKKLLFKIFFGFSLGITLLMVAYIGIYYISGQETFNSIIMKLTDITIFQSQLLTAGFIGILLAFAVHLVQTSLTEDKQSPFMIVFCMFLSIIILGISMLFMENIGSFDEVTVNILIIITVVLFVIYTLVHCMQSSIEQFIINKKIKEKNSK